MNKFILEELKKVKNCNLPDNFQDLSNFIIQKQDRCKLEVIQGGRYLIELEDYLLNPPEDFTLHINWNNGIIPKVKVLNAYIDTVMGKMIKIQGYSIDSSYSWVGWLPQKSIKIIKKLQ